MTQEEKCLCCGLDYSNYLQNKDDIPISEYCFDCQNMIYYYQNKDLD